MSSHLRVALVAAWVLGTAAGCFDPDLQSGIACSLDGECPGSLECVDRQCVPLGTSPADASAKEDIDAYGTPIDASEERIDAGDELVDASEGPIDASEPTDGAVPEDAPPPDQDAGNTIECDPVIQDCADINAGRCTLIITQQGPPHDAILGCALDRTPKAPGDICQYVHTGDRGLEDDCGTGLICDDSGRCREPCEDSTGCAFDEFCAPFKNINQNLSPYGLCQPS